MLVLTAVGPLALSGSTLPLALLPLPIVLWAAVRLGVRWALADVAVLAVVSAGSLALGRGPFAAGQGDGDALLVVAQLDLVTTVAVVLVLGAYASTARQTSRVVRSQAELLDQAFADALPAMLLVSLDGRGRGRILTANRSAHAMLGDHDPAHDPAADLPGAGWDGAAADPPDLDAPVVDLTDTDAPVVDLSLPGHPGRPDHQDHSGHPDHPDHPSLSGVADPDDGDGLIGSTWSDLVDVSDRSLVDGLLVALAQEGAPSWRGEIAHLRPDAQPFTALVSAVRTVTERHGVCASVQMVDVHDRKAAEHALRQVALHDPLTGLPNRLLLAEHIDKALAVRAREHTRVALLCCDADGFKAVNDAAGAAVGDELLTAMAERLLSLVRPTDTVARVGGDEFVVLCPDLGDADEAQVIARRLLAAFELPFPVGGTSIQLSMSVGIATAGEETTAETLLGDADAAMHRAKRRGRNRVETYVDELRIQAERRVRVASDLRRALSAGELRVHYQPIVDLRDGAIMGAEALVRWQHPELGLLSPASFLDIAEESDLICEIDDWVLARACVEATTWAALTGRPALDLHVNLSARHLGHRRASRAVRSALGNSGLSPRRLVVELTETSLLTVNRSARADLDEIKDTGARLAADDFGTGYSTMTQLVALPLDQIKIDRYFVTGMVQDTRALAVVQALTGLARSLHQDVIAEGLETTDQADTLDGLGVVAVQGYLPCPPVEPDELCRIVEGGGRLLVRTPSGPGTPTRDLDLAGAVADPA